MIVSQSGLSSSCRSSRSLGLKPVISRFGDFRQIQLEENLSVPIPTTEIWPYIQVHPARPQTLSP